MGSLYSPSLFLSLCFTEQTSPVSLHWSFSSQPPGKEWAICERFISRLDCPPAVSDSQRTVRAGPEKMDPPSESAGGERTLLVAKPPPQKGNKGGLKPNGQSRKGASSKGLAVVLPVGPRSQAAPTSRSLPLHAVWLWWGDFSDFRSPARLWNACQWGIWTSKGSKVVGKIQSSNCRKQNTSSLSYFWL